MSGAMMMPEFDHEFAQTRRTIERVPEERFDWKPHEKSFSLYELTAHLGEIPQWLRATLEHDELDLETYERVLPKTKQDILDRFDAAVEAARAALEKATSEDFMTTWTMKSGDDVMMSMPKGAVLRSFVMNHNVHHRAQLGVYLRLLGVPVPAIYGPSADEQ